MGAQSCFEQRPKSSLAPGQGGSCRGRPSTSPSRDQLWKHNARRKIELRDKGDMLMAVLDATADGLLCRPHSPNGRQKRLNSSGALEIFVDDVEQTVTGEGEGWSNLGHSSSTDLGRPQAQPDTASPRQRSAWHVHAQARSVGVKALQSLAARHTQTVVEKEECEAVAMQALSQQEQLATVIVELQDQRATLIANLRSAHAKLREAAQREKDKENEHARAIDLIVQNKSMEARALMVDVDRHCVAAQREKDKMSQLEQSLIAAEVDSSGLLQRVRQLEHANTYLLAESARGQLQLEEAQRDIKTMNDNFSVALSKLSSVKQHVVEQERRYHDSYRALQDRNKVLEAIFKEEAAMRQNAEFSLNQLKISNVEKIADLEAKVCVFMHLARTHACVHAHTCAACAHAYTHR